MKRKILITIISISTIVIIALTTILIISMLSPTKETIKNNNSDEEEIEDIEPKKKEIKNIIVNAYMPKN